MAVRNSISSGHNILSTIHADKAESIPNRLYSLLESNIDLEQFLRSIHRYVQLGVHVKGYYSKERQRFHREISEVVEFYVTEDNTPKSNILYKKTPDGKITLHNPTKYLLDYLESQGLIMQPDILVKEEFKPQEDYQVDSSNNDAVIDKSVDTPIVSTPKPLPVNFATNINNQGGLNSALVQNNQPQNIQVSPPVNNTPNNNQGVSANAYQQPITQNATNNQNFTTLVNHPNTSSNIPNGVIYPTPLQNRPNNNQINNNNNQ